jgi:hypothetical protein
MTEINRDHISESEHIILSVIKDYTKYQDTVRIIVPSTYEVDKKLEPSIVRFYRNECIQRMNSIFGGSTAFHASGSYLYQEEDEHEVPTGDPRNVSECVLYVESFVNITSESKLLELIEYAEYLCEKMSQDSVLVGFNRYNIYVKAKVKK